MIFNISCVVYKYLSNLKPYDYEKNYLILLFLAIACQQIHTPNVRHTKQRHGDCHKAFVPEADIDYWD